MATKVKRSVNISMTAGLVFGFAIVGAALFFEGGNPWIYINLIGLLIVVGGMSASALIMFSFSEIRDVVLRIWACLYGHEPAKTATVFQIVKIAHSQQQDMFQLNRASSQIDHPMLKEALELMSIGLKADDLKKFLDLRMETTRNRALSHAGFLLTLAKLGPAFGLVGTLVGLVALLFEMGSGAGMEKVGPAMALSLTATLYGVALANMILFPLAEYVNSRAEQMNLHDRLILEGVLMLKEKRHPIHIRETLKSYLSWSEYRTLDQMFAGGTGEAPAGAQAQAPQAKEKGVA